MSKEAVLGRLWGSGGEGRGGGEARGRGRRRCRVTGGRREQRREQEEAAAGGRSAELKMSKALAFRALVRQRLTAALEEIFGLFEGAVAEYEEEIGRQRSLLEARPEPGRGGAGVYGCILGEETCPPEPQDRGSSPHQEDLKRPHIKEEHKQLQVQQEDEVTVFGPILVKTAQRFAEETREAAEPMETAADRRAEPEETARCLQPGAHDTTSQSAAAGRGFSCPDCSKTFSQKAYLLEHLRCHRGEKAFTCSICNRGFPWRKQLQRHMRTHLIEQKLGCSACHKVFSWPYQLRVHQCASEESSRSHPTQPSPNWRSVPVSHVGHGALKQFPCSLCGETFGLKDMLLRHLRCHTEDEPGLWKAVQRTGNTGKHAHSQGGASMAQTAHRDNGLFKQT
ncbi:unnamed protein product [Menidia menidia]|uniref:(Atlantic silverside) hypothetical protein n=1 Tax=Menidia menidia TaxID=238744 RepID=A0A8S4AKI8_9TELE|nr:unnamed protein product [Menidia menidia]